MAEITVTKDNFEKEVLEAKLPVLLDFWATWCGPCRMLGPVLEEIAAEREGKLIVGKVNCDEEEELAMKFGVMSIPFLVLMKDGKALDSSVGYRPKAEIEKMLDL